METPRDAPPDAARLRAYLVGLTVECPHGGNPPDCQIHQIRLLPASDRVRWVASLSDAECLEIYRAHRECSAAKELIAAPGRPLSRGP